MARNQNKKQRLIVQSYGDAVGKSMMNVGDKVGMMLGLNVGLSVGSRTTVLCF